MTCNITGQAVLPDGAVAARRTLKFYREPLTVEAQDGSGVIPEAKVITVAADGSVDFELLSGSYTGMAQVNGSPIQFTFTVPDEASATFAECLVLADPVAFDTLAWSAITGKPFVSFASRADLVDWVARFWGIGPCGRRNYMGLSPRLCRC